MIIDFLLDARAAAGVEMALVAPMLLIIMLGSTELGNYFLNEHSLMKAVRDGARFAARQNFSNYPTCTSVSTTLTDDTRNVVMYGYLSGSQVLTPNITTGDITVSTQCFTGTVGGETMTGLYKNRANGAQVVTVNASVPYRSILGSFGFTGIGMTLNASSQAAVTGL